MELFNAGTATADLSDARIVKTDEDGLDEDIYTFPAGTTVQPGAYVVVATLSGELQAGISNSKEVGLTLVDASGRVLDRFDRDSDVGADKTHPRNGSYARIPNGTGTWTVVSAATRGTANKE